MANAIRKHKLLVLGCAVICALIGLIGGASRKPTYTAAATLQVGKVNPNSPGFYGFVQSATDLAAVFSRAITAGPVLARVHARLGLSPAEAAARVSAAPIPASPAFRVIGTGSSALAARRLANATSVALIAYEGHSNTYNPDTKRLLGKYRSVSMQLARASAQVKEAAREYARYPFVRQREELEQAQAARSAASLEAQALASSYQLSAQSTTRGLLTLVAGAMSASSDRSSKIQLLGFIGLLGGLVIGCALAILLAHRQPRRAMSALWAVGDG